MTDYIVIIVLGLITLTAIAFPFLVGVARYDDAADLDQDIRRYRDAVTHGTVCGRCRAANPPGSKFCGECGRPLLA